MRRFGAVLLLALASCDDAPAPVAPASAPAPAAASSSAAPLASSASSVPQEEEIVVTPELQAKVLALFADLADRSVAAAEEATKAGAKSRVAYAYALALATPAGFSAAEDLQKKHGVSSRMIAAAMRDETFLAKVKDVFGAKLEPIVKDLDDKNLEKTDKADCERFARKLVELAAAGRATNDLRAALAPVFGPCVPELPKHVVECLPQPTSPITVEAYDACLAKGAPPATK